MMTELAQTRPPLLEMCNIVKTFPGVKALDGVSFDLRPGEIHALVGENGAGKSTLMKILGGVYSHYDGEILINAVPQRFHDVHESQQDLLNWLRKAEGKQNAYSEGSAPTK